MNYRRIVRRATHASRSIPAVFLAIIVTVAAGWAATEIALHALGRTPLLLLPNSAWQTVLNPATLPQTYAIAGGVVAVVIGLVAILLAIKPGRLSKRQRSDEYGAIVVDDSLIAGFIAHELARIAQIPDSHVDVTLLRRQARANLIPLSGLPIATTDIENHLQSLLDHAGFRPPLKAQIKVAGKGKVGA